MPVAAKEVGAATMVADAEKVGAAVEAEIETAPTTEAEEEEGIKADAEKEVESVGQEINVRKRVLQDRTFFV